VTVLIATHDAELLGNAEQRVFTLSHGELTA
jgi:cell division transport system ATP-binding protein